LHVAVANPTWTTVPCRRTERRQAAREFSFLAHSIATSTPTVVCSRISAGTSSVIGSNTPAHSPQDSMNFLRPGFGSATKICEAPTALTEITVNAPIGPAPEIKTVFPACKPLLSTAYSATAAGSRSAPCSSETESGNLLKHRMVHLFLYARDTGRNHWN
jgi:hypothetical protein